MKHVYYFDNDMFIQILVKVSGDILNCLPTWFICVGKDTHVSPNVNCMPHEVLSKISPLTLKWQSIFFKAISICSKCLIKKVIRELFLSPILHKNLIVIPCLFSVDFQVVLISTCIEKLKIFKIHFKIAEKLSSF